MHKDKISILQPIVPHYRTEFYESLKKRMGNVQVYLYKRAKAVAEQSMKSDMSGLLYVKAFFWHGVLFYNPFPLLRNTDTVVLMLHKGHITTWLLLLSKWLHRRKIILWGHGISVPRYLKEQQHPNRLSRWMIALSDGVWLYMPSEAEMWHKVFPSKPIVALCNTLSGTEKMTKIVPTSQEEEQLKQKHHIEQPIVLIFCARFTTPLRRTDLLEAIIKRLPTDRYAFVIIGDGPYKPDFSPYPNVHDFGAVYDTALKNELFALSDIYLQPGWVGLSIVEAMAYGLPIFTFRRSAEIVQCVEYSYIMDGENGRLFDSVDHCVDVITQTTQSDLQRMGNNARELVAKELTIDNMVERACSIL